VRGERSVSIKRSSLVALSMGIAAGAGFGAYMGANFVIDILLAAVCGFVALRIARWLPTVTMDDMLGGSDKPLDTPSQRRADYIGLFLFAPSYWASCSG
jgi:hypothetical protein